MTKEIQVELFLSNHPLALSEDNDCKKMQTTFFEDELNDKSDPYFSVMTLYFLRNCLSKYTFQMAKYDFTVRVC
jgi:hypothetical protein